MKNINNTNNNNNNKKSSDQINKLIMIKMTTILNNKYTEYNSEHLKCCLL